MKEKIAVVIGLLLASCAKMQDLSPTNTTDAIVKCGNQTCLRLTLDNDYGLRFTIGTPPKNIKLMPAFHTHRTFVTSNQCLRCKNKAFDPNNSTTDEDGNPAPLRYLEYLFDHYGE